MVLRGVKRRQSPADIAETVTAIAFGILSDQSKPPEYATPGVEFTESG
jgi:hypothetical protein